MNDNKRGRGQPPKPPELKKQNVTIKLSPVIIKKLRTAGINQSQLIENLLSQYFDNDF